MKLPFLFFLLFLIPTCNAQDTTKVQVGAGYGLYEAFFVRGSFLVKKNQHLGLSMGHNFGVVNKENYLSFTIEYDYFLKNKGMQSISPWFICPKIHFTKLENEYYLWSILFYGFSIGKTFGISEKINVSIDAGPEFKLVLYFKRKTFEEVAWPYNIRPNLRLMLNYKL